MRKKLIVFTDLDGTLLDSVYSFRKALPALKAVKEKNIPLILCSSKTRAEIEHCRKNSEINIPLSLKTAEGYLFRKNIQDSVSRIQDPKFRSKETIL